MARFVQIAMGSASELQNHLRLARDFEFLSSPDYGSIIRELTSVRQMLTAFLQTLRGVRPKKFAPASLAKSE